MRPAGYTPHAVFFLDHPWWPSPPLLALAVALAALGAWSAPRRERAPGWLPPALLGAALVLGFGLAWSRLALFDDAYISLRYARNFADGHGLVWNIGERVEGYTNFSWTVLLGSAMRLTGLGGPGLALGFSLAVFLANLLTAAAVGRSFGGKGWLPLAALALAGHPVFTAYGSTGMETGFGALWVLLGAGLLAHAARPSGYAVAGLAFIAAALTRPDHGLFYAVGSALVFGEQVLAWRRAEATTAQVAERWAAWAAPFLLYVAYVVWKVNYYGHVMPNTYYAKSADSTWWTQGFFYARLFWVGNHGWLALLLAPLATLSKGPRRRFALFAVASAVLYTLYTARVGGDFMHGRFFVAVLAPVLLCVEGLTQHRRRAVAGLAALALALSVAPFRTFDGRRPVRGVVDESAYWPVDRVWPRVEQDTTHYKLGTFLRDEVVARGIRPVLGSGGIGAVGYFSGLTLVDSRGLTDATVARQPLKKRTRPGHEKRAPRAYILERGVHLLRQKGGQRGFHPKRFRKLTRVSFPGAGTRDPWQIAWYDRELMIELGQIEGIEFLDFERWLQRYVEELPRKKPADVSRDLPWLKGYWFDRNDDPGRLALIEARAAE